MNISLIPKDSVGMVWPKVKKLLEPAVSRSNGRYHIDDILYSLQVGADSLWVAFRDGPPNAGLNDRIVAAVVTRISKYPRRKNLVILFLGGTRMSEWVEEFHSVIEKWARDTGCESIETSGRLGWNRYTKRFGWFLAYGTYEKDLSNG